MTRITDAIKSVFLAPDTEEKTPLHVGEVMSLWFFLTALREITVISQIGMNTTTDSELLDALKKSFDDCDKHADEVISFLQKEGIPLPPTTESKPKSDPMAVPSGVKLTDNEIANLLSLKTAATLAACTTGLTQSIRGDVGEMWLRFYMKKVEFGIYLKPIMLRRGWMMYPPLYNPPGSPPRQ